MVVIQMRQLSELIGNLYVFKNNNSIYLIIVFFSFITENFEVEKNDGKPFGWVVKAPFTTGCAFIRYCNSLSQILISLRTGSQKYYGSLPYLMIQARMINNKEYKVVVLNGSAKYLAYNTHRHGVAFSSKPHKKLFDFAESAVQQLKASNPSSIIDMLVRVDIFQTYRGDFVVNEFESLEADYFASEHCQMFTENAAYMYLLNCFCEKIRTFVRSKLY